MKIKRILLLGGNYFPELTGIGKYNGEMIEWLASHGFECTVVTTFPYYPQWKIHDSYSKQSSWYKKEYLQSAGDSLPVKIIRCPHFVPKNPSGSKRILSDLTFFLTSSIVVLGFLFKRKYDFIITVAPPFQVGLLGLLYKKIKGAQFLYHIQDLQVDAARDLNMIKSSVILKILFAVEKFILKRADFISTISEGMIRKVQLKCNKDIVYFPNWTDIDFFKPISNKNEHKPKFGFDISDRIILYSGAIGEKQGLEAILHSAKYFEDIPGVKFLVCGTGPYKENLVKSQQEMGLKNVFFFPLQPPDKFNMLLNLADIHLVLQKAVASDLVMPSKLTAILSVGGLAIVTASAGTSLYEMVKSTNTGIVIEPDNQRALNLALENGLKTDNLAIRKNARQYAEERLSIDTILQAFAEKVLNHERLRSKSNAEQLISA